MSVFRLRFSLIVAGTAAATLTASAIGRADTPGSQLVYAFSYGSEQNITARDAADNAESMDSESGFLNDAGYTNGISHYHGQLNDKGTMTVDIVKKQPDGGLIVSISEAGETTRRAPPATCVVYGNTSVICDPNKTVYPEEYTLLRFLGANFVDPSQLDAKRHWAISQPSGGGESVTADYTINSSANGAMQISETRTIRPAAKSSPETDITAKIGYDFPRAVPTSIDEYTMQRQENGTTGSTRTIYQTTLNLLSDTMAKT
jgi:hypothetical protein